MRTTLIVPVITAALLLCSLAGIGTADNNGDIVDYHGYYADRSNVMESTVDPSFWDDWGSLEIGKVEKRLVLPSSNPKTPIVSDDIKKPSGEKFTPEELTILTKAQEVAQILISSPYYQAGEAVFKLNDNEHVKLSSVKYAATQKYYGRTDISSVWVTEFYNAAYDNDYSNLTVLLDELPPEV